MLQKDLDKSRSSACRAYEDPFFRTRAGKCGLATRLWNANMPRFTKRRRGPAIRCFCVVKKVGESGEPILRLSMDLRKTNLLFVSPPYTTLANGASFGFVDLSPSVLGGTRVTSFSGDVPDYFYRSELHPELSEYFASKGRPDGLLVGSVVSPSGGGGHSRPLHQNLPASQKVRFCKAGGNDSSVLLC